MATAMACVPIGGVGLAGGCCCRAGARRQRDDASAPVPTLPAQALLPLAVLLEPLLLLVGVLALAEVRMSTAWQHRGRAEPSAAA